MNVGDLLTTNFSWGWDELWDVKQGYIPRSLMNGDIVVVLETEQKRVKVLTSRGNSGWITKGMLKVLE